MSTTNSSHDSDSVFNALHAAGHVIVSYHEGVWTGFKTYEEYSTSTVCTIYGMPQQDVTYPHRINGGKDGTVSFCSPIEEASPLEKELEELRKKVQKSHIMHHYTDSDLDELTQALAEEGWTLHDVYHEMVRSLSWKGLRHITLIKNYDVPQPLRKIIFDSFLRPICSYSGSIKRLTTELENAKDFMDKLVALDEEIRDSHWSNSSLNKIRCGSVSGMVGSLEMVSRKLQGRIVEFEDKIEAVTTKLNVVTSHDWSQYDWTMKRVYDDIDHLTIVVSDNKRHKFVFSEM